MSTSRLGMCLTLAVAATFGSGCLDDGGGPQDQWMNTDAYVGPEVSVTTAGDGGVTCGDAIVYGDPAQLSQERVPDGGVLHPQYDLTMAGAGAGARYVAWTARDLSQAESADVLAAPVPAAGAAGAIITVTRPDACTLLVEPVLAVTAAGTAVLAATCVLGTEAAPTLTSIVLFRSVDGLQTFQDPVVAAACPGETQVCSNPSLAATAAGALWVAWSEWSLESGVDVGVRARVLRSDDDGLTLGTEATLAGSFVASALPRLAVGPDDGVHLAYAGAFTYGGTVYPAYALLGTGDAFGEPEVFGAGFDARVVATSAAVHVVWVAGDSVLMAAHSVGGVFAPALPVGQVAGTASVYLPALAADPDGAVHLLWQAFDGEAWRVYYSVTADQGASWLEPMLIAGPFHGDTTGTESMAHLIGRVDLHADAEDVTLGWAESAATNVMTGVSNVYLARRRCP